MIKIAIVAGPTASGKTGASVKLAHMVRGQVISADSIQVYRHMDIGSAKIRRDEMEGVKHHLIDILDPTEDFNVSLFRSLADEKIRMIHGEGDMPLICGGTGFYIRALLYGADFAEGETDPDLRKKLEDEAERYGLSHMEDRLREVDPEYVRGNPGNLKRIIRALEYHALTGKRMSDKNREEREREPVYDARYFVLDLPRDLLYERIDARVDRMMEAGLMDEVRRLRDMGVTRDMTSMQGLGYRQAYDCLEGLCTPEDMVNSIKQQTRHFAKRQLTWYRKEKDVIWIRVEDPGDSEGIALRMKEYMDGKI